MQENVRDIDWNSEEGKQATERLNSVLRHIDNSAAEEGLVRTVIPLGEDENGQPFGIIAWGKP